MLRALTFGGMSHSLVAASFKGALVFAARPQSAFAVRLTGFLGLSATLASTSLLVAAFDIAEPDGWHTATLPIDPRAA